MAMPFTLGSLSLHLSNWASITFGFGLKLILSSIGVSAVVAHHTRGRPAQLYNNVKGL